MRRERKHHYIYKTTCKVTNKFYVGMHSTDNLEDGYLGSGKKLWYSIRKHGAENHEKEILEFLPNRSSLKNREKEIVNERFLENTLCINIALGGGGGFGSEEHMKKCSSAGNDAFRNRLQNDPEFKKRFSDYARIASSKANKKKPPLFTGKTHSEETKQKIGKLNSEKQKGDGNSQHGTCWITNGSENKKIKKTDDLPEGWSYGRKIKSWV